MLFDNEITESEELDATEGIDVDHISVWSSELCNCYFYFFQNINFNYELHICNGCHDAALHAQAITDIKIISIKSSTYRVVSNMSREESTRLLELYDLDEKLGYL